MVWLRRAWGGLCTASRWVAQNTRQRLSARGQLIFDWIAGLLLIVLGVVGLFVPILQGGLFILAGLAILSKRSALAHRLLERIKRAARGVRDRYRATRKNKR